MSPLWMRFLLIASLAFNIAVGGAWLWHKPHGDMHMPDAFIDRVTEGMDKADANTVRSHFEARREAFKKQDRDAETAFQVIKTALTASPYDSASFRAALEQGHEARVEMDDLMRVTLAETAPELSDNGRARLVPPRRGH